MMDSDHETFLSVRNLSMTFQGEESLETLDDLTFSLGKQEFLCVLGPSGSGKSTLLRLIAGLLKPTTGEIIFNNAEVSPRIGLVFQQANLMPWRTVFDNIILPLELQGVEKTEAHRQAEEMIRLVGLEEFSHAWPAELSGGMAQRVAIARAYAADPDLLLLDEPFGSLDALTREKMGTELLRIWQEKRKAVIMVTHSIAEALLLSDRVMVFSPRPAHIHTEVSVNLARPRNEEMRYSKEILLLEKELRQALR